MENNTASKPNGVIALMGSGELTATMVEVHKALLRRYGQAPNAVFLDTPAGFQLNVEALSQKAQAYFETRIQAHLAIASYQSAEDAPEMAQQAFNRMRQADYIFMGPGSPTYALRQWQQSPVPDIFYNHVYGGGCLVAASAAALTIGRIALPVYEIYKVGNPIHWVDGLDILGRFGFDLAVIPHWNNAEGGNHDTRFCFMGAERMERLIEAAPETTKFLGLDEHTALIIDLEADTAAVEGIGRVVIKDRHGAQWFTKGDPVPMNSLVDGPLSDDRPEDDQPSSGVTLEQAEAFDEEDPWTALHAAADRARRATENGQDAVIGKAILELEHLVWAHRAALESQNAIGAARELLREVIAVLVAELTRRPKDLSQCVSHLVKQVLDARETFRAQKMWKEADMLRRSLESAGITVHDAPGGSTWTLTNNRS